MHQLPWKWKCADVFVLISIRYRDIMSAVVEWAAKFQILGVEGFDILWVGMERGNPHILTNRTATGYCTPVGLKVLIAEVRGIGIVIRWAIHLKMILRCGKNMLFNGLSKKGDPGTEHGKTG